jgi:hypothetical protein
MMENLDSHEKPTLPNHFTRGSSRRMLPHGLVVVAVETACGSTIPAWLPSWLLLSWCGCLLLCFIVDRQQSPELLEGKDGWCSSSCPVLGRAGVGTGSDREDTHSLTPSLTYVLNLHEYINKYIPGYVGK